MYGERVITQCMSDMHAQGYIQVSLTIGCLTWRTKILIKNVVIYGVMCLVTRKSYMGSIHDICRATAHTPYIDSLSRHTSYDRFFATNHNQRATII